MKFTNYMLSFLILISFSTGQDSRKEIPQKLYGGLKYSITDRMNHLIFATSALAAIGSYQYDQKVKKYALREGLLSDDLSRAGDLYGGALSHWILWTTILAHSKLTDEPKNEFWEKIEFSSLALTANALVTYLLKFGIGRERPNGGDNFSFPSGHTSHSFTIAAVTNELYGRKIGTLAYCMATLSAISRVHDNMHYLSDIIIGAGIGTIIGRGFSIQYKKRTKKHVYLLPSKKGVTLAVIF